MKGESSQTVIIRDSWNINRAHRTKGVERRSRKERVFITCCRKPGPGELSPKKEDQLVSERTPGAGETTIFTGVIQHGAPPGWRGRGRPGVWREGNTGNLTRCAKGKPALPPTRELPEG